MKCSLAGIEFPTLLALGLIAVQAPWVQSQVVQLPSTRSLSYSGSVWVPDGGSTSLGGYGYGRSSAIGNGLGPNSSRAISGELQAGSVSVSAQIIDLSALDAAILASASPSTDPAMAEKQPAGLPPAAPQAVSNPASPPLQPTGTRPSITATGVGMEPEIHRRAMSAVAREPVARHPSLLESDIRYYVLQGEAAENAGRLIAARVYYMMARDLMSPELNERYERVLLERQQAEEARRNAELEAVRRQF